LGGPERGERLLSDSNFDWGQGLKDLRAWSEANGIADLSVWYFGTDPAVLKPPFRLQPLHTLDVTNETQLRRHVAGRYLAVSTTLSHGSYLDEPAWLIRRLRITAPFARTRTFLIFDLDQLAPAAQQQVGQQPERAEHQHKK